MNLTHYLATQSRPSTLTSQYMQSIFYLTEFAHYELPSATLFTQILTCRVIVVMRQSRIRFESLLMYTRVVSCGSGKVLHPRVRIDPTPLWSVRLLILTAFSWSLSERIGHLSSAIS